MLDTETARSHEAAFNRPRKLWPLKPWISWGYHGFFIPGHTAYQFFRFCIIGGIGVLVNLVVYYLCNNTFGMHYVAASVLAFLVASLNNFTLNKIFTFHDKKYSIGSVFWQYFKFLSVALIGLGINLGVLTALVELAGLSELVGQLIGVLTATVSNFLGNKFFAFKVKV